MYHYCNRGLEAEVQIFMLPFTKDSLWESDINFSPAVFQKSYFAFCSGFLGIALSHANLLFDYYFQKRKGRNSDMHSFHSSHCL